MGMHPALQGLLIGIGLALFFVMFEWMGANKSANVRAKKMAKKPEWDQDEKARFQAVVRFCFVLPIGFALFWWLISGWF